MISLDGFFEGPGRDISWHYVDEEFNNYAAGFLDSLDTLLFGRVTYELMAEYWPIATVRESDPLISSRMNGLQKKVFSRTLSNVEWENSQLVGEFNPEEIRKLKEQPGKDMAIGGSDLALEFIRHNLIDEYRIIVAPIVLGSGKRLFEGQEGHLALKLVSTRVFNSGNVLHIYEPGNIPY